MSRDMRAALFGHTKAVNADYHTTRWTPEDMLALITEKGRRDEMGPGFEPLYEGGRRRA